MGEKMTKKKTEEKKQEKKEVKSYFVLTLLPTGGFWVGQVLDVHYDLWVTNQMKLLINQPKEVAPTPVMNSAQTKIQGYKLNVVPTYPMKTGQDQMPIDPVSAEILGEVRIEEGLPILYESVGANKELFAAYIAMLDQWQSELSPIERPTASEVVATTRQQEQGNVSRLPFDKRG